MAKSFADNYSAYQEAFAVLSELQRSEKLECMNKFDLVDEHLNRILQQIKRRKFSQKLPFRFQFSQLVSDKI